MNQGLAYLDADARARLGKSILDCTAEDLKLLAALNEADAIRQQADVDRAAMVAAEADACGCNIVIPFRADGSQDIGRAFVSHTCGKALL